MGRGGGRGGCVPTFQRVNGIVFLGVDVFGGPGHDVCCHQAVGDPIYSVRWFCVEP